MYGSELFRQRWAKLSRAERDAVDLMHDGPIPDNFSVPSWVDEYAAAQRVRAAEQKTYDAIIESLKKTQVEK
jgi:hypothetical protein